jgi:hypothetical protein
MTNSLVRDEKIILMREAVGFFFVDSDKSFMLDFHPLFDFELLTVEGLKQQLACLQVCEEYECWDMDTLCMSIVRLYDVLISVYSRKNGGLK